MKEKMNQIKAQKLDHGVVWLTRDDDKEGRYALHFAPPVYHDSREENCSQISHLEEGDYEEINECVVCIKHEPEPRPCEHINSDRRSNPECLKCDLLNSYWSSNLSPEELVFTSDQWAGFGTGVKLQRGEGPVKLLLIPAELHERSYLQ